MYELERTVHALVVLPNQVSTNLSNRPQLICPVPTRPFMILPSFLFNNGFSSFCLLCVLCSRSLDFLSLSFGRLRGTFPRAVLYPRSFSTYALSEPLCSGEVNS